MLGSAARRTHRPPASQRGRAGDPVERRSSSASRGRTPGVDQVVVLLAHAAALDRGPGAHRAQHGVARRVLALDELHDVDAVALLAHQRGPQRVGERVGEPLAQDAVPGEHGVRRRGRCLAQLGGDVVVAARRGEHQLRIPVARAWASASSVAVSQACRASTTSGAGSSATPPMEPTTNSASTPRSRGDRAVVLARLLLDVDAGQAHRQAAHVGEEALRGEGEVGVAAAEVDDPQRVLRRRPAQVALVERLGDRGVEQPQELLDLAVLRLPARLDPAVGVGDARARRTPGRPRAAAGPCRGRGRGRPRPARARSVVCTTASSFLVTRSWWLWVVVSTCQLPNGSSSSVVDRVPRGVADGVVGGVRLGCVVRRDLQVPAGLEVDVAQLDAPPGRLPAPLPSRRRPRAPGRRGRGQRSRIRFSCAQQRLVAHHSTAASDDDQQQRHQGHRDDESAVAGVHAREILEASSSARCICGDAARGRPAGPGRTCRRRARPRPGGRGRRAAGGSRRPRPTPRSGPSPCRSCRPARSSPATCVTVAPARSSSRWSASQPSTDGVVAVRLGHHLDAVEVGQRQVEPLEELGEGQHVEARAGQLGGVAAQRGQAGRLEADDRHAGVEVRRERARPCAA